ncbi:FitA-like ribbon-helix-helix domain-containing protein [Rhodohalobacter halophilus]|uniref:FitA-like ribbon-helix-helix domain-containing protein n=1 Tax=Rhodohalobacter halophilus TaxID=1812810 RepID=UPI0038B51E3B
MPDVLIRNIDEKTLENLKKKAAENNRSLEAELNKAEFYFPLYSGFLFSKKASTPSL